MPRFNDMLVYLRKREGLSQEALARATGISRSAIGMYETGKREPDFETLEVLADYFNVNMSTLIGDNTQPAPPQDESVVLLNRAAERMTPEQRKQLIDMAKVVFADAFKE